MPPKMFTALRDNSASGEGEQVITCAWHEACHSAWYDGASSSVSIVFGGYGEG